MRPYHPDDSGMTWRQRNNNGGGNNGGNNMGGMMPGQIKGIANDLQMGYGGTDAKWRNYLHNVYSPVKPMSFHFGGGNGGGNKGGNPDPSKPGGGPNQPSDGGFDPSSPRNRMAPMAMQRPMMQTPQMGLLNAPMPLQQPMQQGLLGDLDPAILSYLMRR